MNSLPRRSSPTWVIDDSTNSIQITIDQFSQGVPVPRVQVARDQLLIRHENQPLRSLLPL